MYVNFEHDLKPLGNRKRLLFLTANEGIIQIKINDTQSLTINLLFFVKGDAMFLFSLCKLSISISLVFSKSIDMGRG